MVDKGGCKVGKKSDKGGCKEGKKKVVAKKFKVRNPGNPIVYKTNPKTGLIEKLIDEAKQHEKEEGKKTDSKKRKFIVRKNMAQVKKANPPPKKKKFVVRNKLPAKKEIISEIQKHTDLTKAEANKIPAIELFGMLPTALRKFILTPEKTGTQVGIAPPLSKEQANTLMNLLDKMHDTSGFTSYISGWSYYEGGNFTQSVSQFWEKKVDQLNKYSFRYEMIELLEEPKMEKIMASTRKKYGDLEGRFFKLKDAFNAKGELDEEMLYSDDYEEYYPEDTYNLIYEDGDYYMSRTTKSTTNKLVKNIIDKELKPEMKQFKAFEKEMKKLIK